MSDAWQKLIDNLESITYYGSVIATIFGVFAFAVVYFGWSWLGRYYREFWPKIMVAVFRLIAAAAAVGIVDAISAHWRDGQTRPVPLQHLLIVADELCNTLPWAKLPTVITEARALALATTFWA